MNNNLFEKDLVAPESLSREDLAAKLEVAEEKLKQIKEAEQQSEFYDKEMYNSFVYLKHSLGPTNPQILELYIGSSGEDY